MRVIKIAWSGYHRSSNPDVHECTFKVKHTSYCNILDTMFTVSPDVGRGIYLTNLHVYNDLFYNLSPTQTLTVYVKKT